MINAKALPPSAPPVFLLDADRQAAGVSPDVGWFDNRSIVRESDLPSASFLNSKNIRHVIVIRADRHLQSDLHAVLLAWQEGGMAMQEQCPGEPWNPLSFTVRRRPALKVWWDKLLNHFGYRLNSSGSFGRFIHGSSG